MALTLNDLKGTKFFDLALLRIFEERKKYATYFSPYVISCGNLPITSLFLFYYESEHEGKMWNNVTNLSTNKSNFRAYLLGLESDYIDLLNNNLTEPPTFILSKIEYSILTKIKQI